MVQWPQSRVQPNGAADPVTVLHCNIPLHETSARRKLVQTYVEANVIRDGRPQLARAHTAETSANG